MNKLIATLLFFCVLVQAGTPQRRADKNRQVPGRLSKNKPTVYISFEHAGDREPAFTRESRSGVWLRLHNNLPWPIILQTYDYTNDEMGFVYGVEQNQKAEVIGERPNNSYTKQEDLNLPLIVSLDVLTTERLRPGRSIVFSVPREYLARGLAIYVPFNYELETKNGITTLNEPEHRVYFYSYELPQNIRND